MEQKNIEGKTDEARSCAAAGYEYRTAIDAAIGYFVAKDGPRCAAYAETFGERLSLDVKRLMDEVAALESANSFARFTLVDTQKREAALNEEVAMLRSVLKSVMGAMHELDSAMERLGCDEAELTCITHCVRQDAHEALTHNAKMRDGQ